MTNKLKGVEPMIRQIVAEEVAKALGKPIPEAPKNSKAKIERAVLGQQGYTPKPEKKSRKKKAKKQDESTVPTDIETPDENKNEAGTEE